MPEIHLEFEKPIAELTKKLRELEAFSVRNNIDVSAELTALTQRIEETSR